MPYFIVSKSELVTVHVKMSMKAYGGGRSDVPFTCLLINWLFWFSTPSV